MKPELSIIIPCYNCEKTLEEAVESCYDQDLKSFEIVMVDDGSTDSTYSLMERLGDKHSEIRTFKQEKNMGGGATRNRAVKESLSEVIFCLDGDDIIPKQVLPKMLALMHKKKSDGVLFEETRFFSNDISKTETVKNKLQGDFVRLEDFFKDDVGFLTRVNFLYTKKAFTGSGGYPTNHGFDTQTFGLRFLSKGFKAVVCPDTYYLHRRNVGPSYFIREYNEGKLSFNGYLMFEDVLFLFSKKMREEIIGFDIFKNNRLDNKDLSQSIMAKFKELGPESFFIKNYEEYLKEGGMKECVGKETPNDSTNMYVKAVYLYKEGKFSEALDAYGSVSNKYTASKIYAMNVLRCFLSKHAQDAETSPEKAVFELFKVKNIPPSIISRIWQKGLRLLRKINS